MKDLKTEYKEKLLKTIVIHNRLVHASNSLDPKTKEGFHYFGNYWTDRIRKESFTITQLKSVTGDILSFWQQDISIDAESFWKELQKNNIDFERKDELNFVLTKGRFRYVGIGMRARKDWLLMRESNSIKGRFSNVEIEAIGRIIELDEKTRLEILSKCLKKKEIPLSQYLKFGECMAYFGNCGLFEKYFSKEQIKELNDIWVNFKSK